MSAAGKKRTAAGALEEAPNVAAAPVDGAASAPAAAGAAASAKKQKVSSAGSRGAFAHGAGGSAGSASKLSAGSSTALTPAAYSRAAIAHAASFSAYTAATTAKAHALLHVQLPRKVLELDALIRSHGAFEHSVVLPFDEAGAFIPGREREPIRSNPSVMALIPMVQAQVLEEIEHLGALKLMIQLRIPAVDDGNNFGVEIQEESINEIAKVEDVAFNYLEKIQNYYGNRTRVVAKISKYPAILDYWQSVKELDEAFFTDMRLFLVDMRNSYTMLHDLLIKNEEKIKNPRGLDSEASGHSRRHAFA